jgi:hypothetical protein
LVNSEGKEILLDTSKLEGNSELKFLPFNDQSFVTGKPLRFRRNSPLTKCIFTYYDSETKEWKFGLVAMTNYSDMYNTGIISSIEGACGSPYLQRDEITAIHNGSIQNGNDNQVLAYSSEYIVKTLFNDHHLPKN